MLSQRLSPLMRSDEEASGVSSSSNEKEATPVVPVKQNPRIDSQAELTARPIQKEAPTPPVTSAPPSKSNQGRVAGSPRRGGHFMSISPLFYAYRSMEYKGFM